MSCEMNEEVLMAYVDGDLPAAERGRVAEHVVGCDECRAAVSDLRAVSGLLAKWQAPEPAGLPTAPRSPRHSPRPKPTSSSWTCG